MQEYPGGWFGASWDAPVCEESRHKPTPVGVLCIDCDEPIKKTDQGMLIPLAHERERGWELKAWHKECFLKNILPPNLR
jgi:hypothetical protein